MERITLNELFSQNPLLLNESFFSMLKVKYIFGFFPVPSLKEEYKYITINDTEYIIESYEVETGTVNLIDEYGNNHIEKIYTLPRIEEDMLELNNFSYIEDVYIKEDCIVYKDELYDILNFVKKIFNNLSYVEKIKIINALNQIDLDNIKVNFNGKIISFIEYINEIKKINTEYFNIKFKNIENLSYKYGNYLIPISSFYNREINEEINKKIPIPLIEERIKIL